MIRKATVQDLPALAQLGLEFFKEGGLPGQLVPSVFVASWTRFIELDLALLFVLEREGVILGAIGGVLFNDINDGEPVASEAFWFVSKEARGGGIKLLDAFETTAKEAGAKRITMVHLKALAPEILEKIYCRRGYSAVEAHYVKTI